MQGHVLAHFLVGKSFNGGSEPAFPFLCLTVSGGHTQIIKVKSQSDMQILGETLDDAAGEAFDKAAKIIGLPYPGGPLIDKFAVEGDPRRFSFSKPNVADLNFSFSGLKTAFLYFIQNEVEKDSNFIEKNKADICASIQHCIVEILLAKLKKASLETGIKEIAISGGVSANSSLRNNLIRLGEQEKWNVYIPPFEYCTDNAAMIAIAGYYRFKAGEFADLSAAPMARIPF